jgi:hypothetical protein
MDDSELPVGGYGATAVPSSREAVGEGSSGSPTKMLLGLKALARDNPWPEFGYGEIEPFLLSLDGNGRGGRELVFDIIREKNISLMVEIGCFLCGSTLQWLRASDKLTVIGVDPWDGNWAAYVERMALDPVRSRSVWHLNDEQIKTIVANLRQYGNFGVAMNNVRLYRQRFYPVRRSSPEALLYLRRRGIVPELIFIDAGKSSEDLGAAFKLFPEAILCGDDWLWPDQTGALRMQENVKAFAAEHGFEIRSSRQTWLLVPRAAAAAPK